MASLVEVEPLLFALIGGSRGAKGIFLNENLAICSAFVI